MRKEMTFTDLLVLLLKKFNAILIVAYSADVMYLALHALVTWR